jgi:cadmium resistance protein CadD (predicted permease)
LLLAGLPADLAVATTAFVATNIDNALVTLAMVAAAPPKRARRIVAGQIIGFVVVVMAAGATAIALFEISPKLVGLLGLVPLLQGVRGLLMVRHPERRRQLSARAVGAGIISAALITVGAGGDNLAVYIPLFRVAGAANIVSIMIVFALGEAILTLGVIRIGQHHRIRDAATRVGVFAAPVLYCVIGLVVLLRAGTI